MSSRIVVDGKFFAHGNERFHFRATRYDVDPTRDADADLARLARSGFTAVASSADPALLAPLAERHQLRVVGLVAEPDWGALLGSSRQQRQQFVRELAARVDAYVSAWSGDASLLAVAVGDGLRSVSPAAPPSLVGSSAEDLARAL